MKYLEVEDLNQFFANDKLGIDPENFGDEGLDRLESSESNLLLSRLRLYYDTSEWIIELPILVHYILAMRVAGKMYTRQFAGSTSELSARQHYGLWLLSEANSLMNQLINGELQIDDNPILHPSSAETLMTDPVFTMEGEY